MNEGKMTFATLVSTPTNLSWSQAYTAGKLYAVLSLEHTQGEQELASIGKEIINALVEEYFTLEQKNLDSIKAAVTQTTKKIPFKLTASFVVVSLVNNIVYAYTYGGGKVLLKRRERVGSVLSTPSQEENPSVHAVSGYLEDKDILILETRQFSEIIENSQFSENFATPAEAVEMLSPKVHGKENGAASAIVLSYIQESSITSLGFASEVHETEEPPKPPPPQVSQTYHQTPIEKSPEEPLPTHSQEEKSNVQTHYETHQREEEEPRSALEEEVLHKHDDTQELPRKRSRKFLPSFRMGFFIKLMLLLLIPLIILGVLGYNIYNAKQRQEEDKIQQLFEQVYPQAQKQYDEGQSLLSLNKDLAKDDFVKAKKIIDDNINKFPKNSSQREQMQQLLQKVESQGVGGGSEASNTLQAKEVDASTSPMLQALLKNTQDTYGVVSNGTIYLGSNKSIETAAGKALITNDNDWKALAGLGVYNGNVYVLDKDGTQILKFLGASHDNKSVYATDNFLAKAISMAIDSSIYVLTSNGAVKKYTRGESDSFSTQGLTTPFNSPTRIFTSADIDSVYVLDKGNSRVVKLSKTGSFQNTFSASVIKDATDFDVDEKNNKLYILANKKVYEITIP